MDGFGATGLVLQILWPHHGAQAAQAAFQIRPVLYRCRQGYKRARRVFCAQVGQTGDRVGDFLLRQGHGELVQARIVAHQHHRLDVRRQLLQALEKVGGGSFIQATFVEDGNAIHDLDNVAECLTGPAGGAAENDIGPDGVGRDVPGYQRAGALSPVVQRSVEVVQFGKLPTRLQMPQKEYPFHVYEYVPRRCGTARGIVYI